MSEILTREEWLPMFHRIVVAQTGAEVDTRFALIAHDAALRADVERLRAENTALFGQTALERRRANNEKARAEKLAAALREIAARCHEDCCSYALDPHSYKCDCHVAIAAAALADGDEKSE